MILRSDNISTRIAVLEAELAELRAAASGAVDPGDPTLGGGPTPCDERERLLDAILEHLPNMVFVKDAGSLRFVRFNRAGEEVLGWPRENLLGKSDYDFFPKDQADFFTAKDRDVLAGREVVDIAEEPIQTARGERWLHTRKVPILGDDGRPAYLLGISEDITEQRSNRLELAQRTEALQRSNRELEQFAFIASHDLKEPLRKIQAFGEILTDDYADRLDAEGLDCLKRMRGASGRLQEMIDSLLTYSRVATRAKPFEPINLAELLAEVASDLEPVVRESGGTIDIGDVPVVLGDRQLVRQMMQNLIGNALKFRKKGVSPVVSVAGRTTERWHEIAVTDNGIGIGAEYHDKIFGMFQRLSSREEYAGSGIGLAVCKKIVERHGGELSVQSQPGEGATFTIRLPVEFYGYDL